MRIREWVAVRRGLAIPEAAHEYSGAALIHRLAMAAGLEPFKKFLHYLNADDLGIKFHHFPLGDLAPAGRNWAGFLEARKQLGNFIERESGLPCAEKYRQLVDCSGIVSALTPYSFRLGK